MNLCSSLESSNTINNLYLLKNPERTKVIRFCIGLWLCDGSSIIWNPIPALKSYNQTLILEQESIRAINTLKKPNVQKIQKIQLMRQYFKDIKTKMQKDEENQKNLSFQVDEESEHKKGVFLKKKSQTATDQTTNGFRFNFNDPSEDNLTDITSKVKSLEIKEI